MAHLCSLVLLITVGARPVSSHRAGLRALEAAGLLQGRQATGECTLLLVPLAWLSRRRTWLLSHGWWRRHLWLKLSPLNGLKEEDTVHGALHT